MVFFQTWTQYLTWDNVHDPLIKNQKVEPSLVEGVKKRTLADRPRISQLRKIEFKTLQFDCDLSIGSEFSEQMLDMMTESKNRELFRSDIKILLEYKWD